MPRNLSLTCRFIFTSVILAAIFSSAANASPTFSLQGRILKPGGGVLEVAGVQFDIRVLSPDASSCILYEETQTKDLTGSGGLFNISLNDGTGTRSDGLPHPFEKTFSNQAPFNVPSAKCGAGAGTVTYTPGPNDERTVLIYFREPGAAAWEQMPAMTLSHSSFAYEAGDSLKVGGFAASNMCRVVDGSGNPAVATAFTSAQFNELLSVSNGNYTKTSANGSIGVPVVAGNPGSGLAAGQMWYDSAAGQLKYYDGAVKTVGTSGGSVTSVAAGTGLTGGPITTTGTLAVDVGTAAGKIVQVQTGGKLPTLDGSNLTNVTATSITGMTLNDGNIWIGNGSNVVSAVTPSGDATMTNLGAITVNKIKGTTVSANPTAAGQVLKYNGTTAYAPGFIGVADIRSTVAGNAQFIPTNCTASQTLVWQAPTDVMACTTIAVTASNFAAQSQNTVLAGPSSGGAGAPSFRTIAPADLPLTGANGIYANGGNSFGGAATIGTNDANSLAFKTNGASRVTVDGAGNVGIGTLTPGQLLDVNGTVNAIQYRQAGVYSRVAPQFSDSTGVSGMSVNPNGAFFSSGNVSILAANSAGLVVSNTKPVGWAPTSADLANQDTAFSRVSANKIAVGNGTNGDATGTLVAGNIGIGSSAPASRLHISAAPVASANYGLISMGSGAFDGTTAGFFTGSANGTLVAGNAATGYTGDLANLQIGGVSKFRVDNSGSITTAGNTSSTGNYSTSGNISTTGSGTITSAGALIVSAGGASVTGGVNNNSGGITNAGNITGVGANLTGSGAMTIASGGTAQNLTLNSSTTGSVNLGSGNGTSLSVLDGGASTVNYVTMKGAATGSAPTIATAGADANIHLVLAPKGTGNVGIGTASPAALLDVNGPIDIGGQNAISFPANDSTTGGSLAVGFGALTGQSGAAANYRNTAVGYKALNAAFGTGAVENTAIGNQALTNGTGSGNTAVGYLSGAMGTGSLNVSMGRAAMYSSGAGNQCVAVGYKALNLATGSGNIAVGAYQGLTVTGGGNVLIGTAPSAGNPLTSGANNVVIGPYVASTTLATGSNNILIGTSSSVDTPAAGTSNFLNIGNTIYGNTSTGNVGIGTTSPNYPLEIVTNAGAGAHAISLVNSNTASTTNKFIDLNLRGTDTVGTVKDVGYFRALPSDVNWVNSAMSVSTRNSDVVYERMRIDSSGNVGIGTTTPASKLHVGVAPAASANYPLFALGTGAFDGSTAGYFTGNANGTFIGVNAASGYTGDLANLQIAGVSKFKVDSTGNIVTVGTTSASGNYSTAGNISTTGAGTISSAGGLTVNSGGANLTGGITNNSGGIVGAGNITGVGANLTGAGAMTIAAGGAAQNLTLNSSTSGSVNLGSGNGTSVSILDGGASTVNYMTMKGGTTGVAPLLGLAGADANIGLSIIPKGTGGVGVGILAPAYKFDVLRTGTVANTFYDVARFGEAITGKGIVLGYVVNSGGTGLQAAYVNSTSADLRFGSSANGNAVTVQAITGYLGVGNTAPVGILDVAGGTAAASTDGTNIRLTAQSAGTGNQNGGNIVLNGGAKSGTGSNGSVLIGTTSLPYSTFPQNSLFVTGSVQANSSFVTSAGNSYGWGTSSAYIGGVGGSAATDYIRMVTNSTERLRIDGSGNIGIGTTAPTTPLQINKDGAGTGGGPNFYTNAGLSIVNSTPATAGVDQQVSLRLTGQAWNSTTGTSQTADWAIGGAPSSQAGPNPSFIIYNRLNGGAWSQILNIDSFGQFQTPFNYAYYGARQTLKAGTRLSNDEASTATYNEYSPYLNMYGSGWKTAATAASENMTVGAVVAPETGATHPVGVWKMSYGTNSTTPTEANELVRYEWGDRLGAVFNKQNIAGFTTSFNGNVGIGTASPTNPLTVNGTASATAFIAGNGSAASPSISFPGNTSTGLGLFSYSADRLDFATSGQIRLSVLNNGTVVMGSLATNIVGNSFVDFNTNLNGFAMDSSGAYMKTANTKRISIDNTGKVGVGNTAPAYNLDVTGDINATGCLRSSVGVASGACVSDTRLKTEVQTFDLGLDALLGIQPKYFKYNGLGGHPASPQLELGVIAQDVEKTAPSLISITKVKLHPDDEQPTELKKVNYTAFSYVLINAVKDLYHRWVSDSQNIHRELASKDQEIEKLKQENAAIKSYLCSKDPTAKLCH